MRSRREITKIAGGIVLGTMSGGCLGLGGSNPGEQVEILQSRGSAGQFGTPTVKGRAKNTGEETLSYVEVSARFYDSSGTRVGTGLDNVNRLGPGRTWEFDAICPDCPEPEYISKYKIEVSASF